MLVGILIPALVAVVTRQTLPAWFKEAALLLLSTASGIVSAAVTNPPTNLSGWEHVALNILITFAMAEASDLAQSKAGTTATLHRLTDRRFGIGPPPADDEGLKAA
jgi:hypothetical protein